MGAQVGFLAGSLLGNLLFPAKLEGPKRSDLTLQRSEYGWTIPYVWGNYRIAGNVVDQTDLIPHTESSGGKGGPTTETTTYSASFQIYICQAPIIGVLRIWADKRLIWSVESGGPMPCILYLGAEDQEPDPTFEGINGVGNEPAYRGVTRAVFVDHSLTDYGDRIAQFEFEVYTNEGVFPWRFSTFEVDPLEAWSRAAATYENGEIHVMYGLRSSYHEARKHYFYDLDGNVTSTSYELVADTFGFVTAHNALYSTDNDFLDIDTGLPITGGAAVDALGVLNGPFISQLYHDTGGTTGNPAGWYIRSLDLGFALSTPLLLRPDPGFSSLFNFGTSNKVFKTSGGYEVGGATVWYLYIVDRNDSPTNVWLREITMQVAALGNSITYAVSRTWDLAAQHAIVPILNGAPFVVYQNRQGRLVLACDRGIVGNKQIYCFYLNDDLTVTAHGGVDYGTYGQTSPFSLLGNGPYMLTGDGVICLEAPALPVILGDIVDDLTDLTPLRGNIDVSELTDEVQGFAVGDVMTVRNALDPLRQNWQFDIVEIDFGAVAKKRGFTDSIYTFAESDLGVRPYGEQMPDLLRVVRDREQSTPRKVALKYADIDLDFQTGTQNSPLLTSMSESDVSLDLPIVMSASEALQHAWTILIAEVVEREAFEWTTTSEFGWLAQCDVVNVQGRVIRITESTLLPNNIIQWKGVLHRPSIYTQEQEGASTPGFGSPEPAASLVPTEFLLLDIPILSQADAPFGFYWAAGPSRLGRWPGATLYRSVDGGENYSPIATTATVSIIGTTQDSTDSPVIPGTLASYGGGDVVDESSLCVVLTDEDAELSSCTADALENGANLCAISRSGAGSPATIAWELLQFRDAVLVAERTYVLTGFKRGRKGTETDDHDIGDRFVLLPVTNVDGLEADLDKEYLYKAITFGQALAASDGTDFINTGLSAKEYYDTGSGHTPTPPGGETGTTYTFKYADNGKLKYFKNASPITATLDPALPVGWWCFIENIGAGDLTIDAGAGAIDEGASTLVLSTDEGVALSSNGDGDFYTMRGMGSGGGSLANGDYGDITVSGGGTTLTIDNDVVTNAKLANMATQTIKGRTTAGTGDPEDLTATQATAILNAMVGDSGSGGTKGLAPAPASGDAAAKKFLRADGTWAAPLPEVVLAPAYAATVTVDLTNYAYAMAVAVNLTLTGNVIFNITNGFDGQIIRLRLKQGGSGSYTFTAGANLRGSTDVPIPGTISTPVGSTDRFGFEWHGGDGKADLVAFIRNYA